MRQLTVGTLLVLLSACAAAPIPVAVGGMAPPVAAVDAPLVSARSYLPSTTRLGSLVEHDRPRAFAVLTNPADRNRNVEFCKSFLGALSDAEIVESEGLPVRVVKTYWPITADSGRDDCTWLVANYDFQRGRTLANVYRLPAEGRRFILAVDPSERSFYIDVTRANARVREQVLQQWFELAAATPDQPGTVLTSPSLWSRVKGAFCTHVVPHSEERDIVTSLAPLGIGTVGGAVVDAAGRVLCKEPPATA